MDKNFKFGGPIGYGNSYLDTVFRYFKVFRLHAILDDAAGAVRLETGKGLLLATAIWLGEDQIQVCSVTWLDYTFAST